MLSRIKDRLAGSEDQEIDHYELRFKPPSGGSWSRASHVTSVDFDISDIPNKLGKESVKTTAESEDWRGGEYCLQPRRENGLLGEQVWSFEVEGEAASDRQQTDDPDPEAVARRAAREVANSNGSEEGMKAVLKRKAESALESGNYEEASVFLEAYEGLVRREQSSGGVLESVQVEDSKVGLGTAAVLELASEFRDNPKAVGQKAGMFIDGIEEARDKADEARSAAMMLRELADREATDQSAHDERPTTDQEDRFGEDDSEKFEPDESIDAGASDMSDLGTSVGTDPDLDDGDTEAAETPESPGDADTNTEAAADGGEDVSRCEGITQDGSRCSRRAEPGANGPYCYQHRQTEEGSIGSDDLTPEEVAERIDGDDGGVRG